MDRRNCVVDLPGPLLDIVGLSPDNCIPGAIGAYVGCSLITGPRGWRDSVCGTLIIGKRYATSGKWHYFQGNATVRGQYALENIVSDKRY